MHVENWPKGIQPKGFQPKRTDGEVEGLGRGRGGSGSESEAVWPEASGRTGAVSRAERDHGRRVSGQAGISGQPGAGVPRQPTASGAPGAPGALGVTGTAGRPGVVPAPWEQPDQPGRNHDPHEVTVQLDGVGREVDEGPGKDGHAGEDAGEDADAAGAGQDSDGPVFVDESGRRRNLYRRLGIAVGTACAAYAVVIVGTLVSGNSDAPWLPVPMQKDDKPAGKVDTPPLPAESDDRSDEADGFVPDTGPDAGPGGGRTGATSPPVAKSPAGSSGRAEQPGKSASAKPSAGPGAGVTPKPKPKPSTGVKDPEPSAPAPEPPKADPSPSAPPPPSPSPSPSETGDPGSAPDSGPDTVADGPASPAPVEPEPSAPENSQSPQEPSSPQGPENPQNPESPA